MYEMSNVIMKRDILEIFEISQLNPFALLFKFPNFHVVIIWSSETLVLKLQRNCT